MLPKHMYLLCSQFEDNMGKFRTESFKVAIETYPYYIDVQPVLVECFKDNTMSLMREIGLWSKENLMDDWVISQGYFRFKNEQDAILFKLKWY